MEWESESSKLRQEFNEESYQPLASTRVIWERAKRFCVRCGHVPTDAIQRSAAHGGFSLAAARLNSYGKSSYLTALSDAAIDVLVDFFARGP
jgi:hypothetical protein